MSAQRERLDELRIDPSQRERRVPRGVLVAMSLALVAVAGTLGWWLNRPRLPAVRLAAVREVGGMEQGEARVLDASGYVVARLRAVVSSKVTGKIEEVLVEEGMSVVAGQVLARLDDALAERALGLAQARLDAARRSLEETEVRLQEARINLRRTEELVAAQVASTADLDADRASVDALAARLEVGRQDVEVAQRELQLREQELADLVIRAPFSGVAVTKDAQPGEMISPISAGGGFTRTGVCTLVDMGSLEIEVDVNEAYINRVRPGQRVTAVLDAYPDWNIPASVITPVPTADRQKATVRVRIAFDALDPRILPDMGVKVSFLADEGRVEAPGAAVVRAVVPRAALRREGEKTFVLVYRDGALERRAVSVGGERGEDVEVLAGVETGHQVVIEGPDDLEDGSRVLVVE
jgi:RND family efflux transporter MFP subunit